MTCSQDRAYRFSSPSQWSAGAHDLEFIDGQLSAPAYRCLEPIDGLVGAVPGGGDNGLLPATDLCGRLNWLSAEDRRWYGRHDFGVEEVGRLDGRESVLEMTLGCSVIWLRTPNGLERHDAYDLRPLGPVAPPANSTILAIASGYGKPGHPSTDNLWILSTDGTQISVNELDRWGRSCRDPIAIPGQVPDSASLVASPDGSSVLVLLLKDATSPDFPALYIAGQGDGDANGPVRRLPIDFEGRVPVSLAFDAPDSIVLLSQPVDDSDSVIIETFDAEGRLLRQEMFEVPTSIGTVLGLGSGPDPIVRGSAGFAKPVDCRRDGAASFTFITPGLTAPIGGKGWNRAELTALIPEGSVIEIDWLSADDPSLIEGQKELIEAVLADRTRSPLSRLLALEELIPWPDEENEAARCRVVGSATDPDNPAVRPILLGSDQGPELWIRVRMVAPPGRDIPSLLSFDALYGNDSYIDELPAIYREDPLAESQLRQILAPFEVLFDQLDATIASLPQRIDPATAPDEWTDYLMSWLGLPRLGDLAADVRREMLQAAPDLLATRGTTGALADALNIVTGDRATIRDQSQEPAAWLLPNPESATGGAAPLRLGQTTIARAQQPPPFRPGTVTLGETPLGQGCPDPELVLGQNSRLITIVIDVPADEARRLAPIVNRLLAVFVPAHCRVEVIYSETDRASRSPELDVDFRLAPDESEERYESGGSETEDSSESRLYSAGHWRLGSTDRLGSWQLPNPLRPSAVLDRRNAPNRDPYLN